MKSRAEQIMSAALKIFFSKYPHLHKDDYYEKNPTKSDTIQLLIEMAQWADENNQNGYMTELTEKCEELDDLEAKLALATEALEWVNQNTVLADPSKRVQEALAKPPRGGWRVKKRLIMIWCFIIGHDNVSYQRISFCCRCEHKFLILENEK